MSTVEEIAGRSGASSGSQDPLNRIGQQKLTDTRLTSSSLDGASTAANYADGGAGE